MDKVHCLIALLSTLGQLSYIENKRVELNNEYSELQKEYYGSLIESELLKVDEVLEFAPKPARFCPHVELSEKEECTYIEFLSNGTLYQLLTSVPSSVYLSPKDKAVITYLDLNKEQKKFNERIMQARSRIKNELPELKTDSWLLGVTIQKDSNE